MSIEPAKCRFEGVRVNLTSPKSYDQMLASLLQDIGGSPVNLDALEQEHSTWESYKAAAEKLAGPSGFMLFGLVDHGAWMAKAGLTRRSIRVILGNPALAITMLQHDLSAGLFAPVEVLVLEEVGHGSSLLYVKPSSLMVVDHNEELLAAALHLDEKLLALALRVASDTQV